jgi:hypothetical protein
MVPIWLKDGESPDWDLYHFHNSCRTWKKSLLDMLDNLPHLWISNSLMKVLLWVLKEGGASDVPLFSHLWKVQIKLCEQCGVPTIPCKSMQGNVFHINDPQSIIAKVGILLTGFRSCPLTSVLRTGQILWYGNTSIYILRSQMDQSVKSGMLKNGVMIWIFML